MVEVSGLTAGGMGLLSCLDLGRLVLALWCRLVAGDVRPWLMAHTRGGWFAWVLPSLGAVATAGRYLQTAWFAGAF